MSDQVTLSDAFAKAQAEFPVIPKDKIAKVQTKSGGQYTYKYADLADILKVVLPILGRHGIAFSQPLRRIEGKTYLVSQLMKGSECLSSDGIPLPDNATPQELGGHLTYYRRYDGCSLLGIAPDEDTDGAQEPKAAPKPAPKSANRTNDFDTPKTVEPPKEDALPTNPALEVPSREEREGFARQITSLLPDKNDQQLLKNVLLERTGKKSVNEVVVGAWQKIIRDVTEAQTSGPTAIDNLLGKVK